MDYIEIALEIAILLAILLRRQPKQDIAAKQVNELLVLAKAPKGPAWTPDKAAPMSGLWETKKLAGDHWVHDGWVREHSPAWKKAWNDPKRILSQGDKTEMGVQ